MLAHLIEIGLTENAIAKGIKTHQSTVSRILSGKIKDPKSSILIAIEQLFEVESKKNNFFKKSIH